MFNREKYIVRNQDELGLHVSVSRGYVNVYLPIQFVGLRFTPEFVDNVLILTPDINGNVVVDVTKVEYGSFRISPRHSIFGQDRKLRKTAAKAHVDKDSKIYIDFKLIDVPFVDVPQEKPDSFFDMLHKVNEAKPDDFDFVVNDNGNLMVQVPATYKPE